MLLQLLYLNKPSYNNSEFILSQSQMLIKNNNNPPIMFYLNCSECDSIFSFMSKVVYANQYISEKFNSKSVDFIVPYYINGHIIKCKDDNTLYNINCVDNLIYDYTANKCYDFINTVTISDNTNVNPFNISIKNSSTITNMFAFGEGIVIQDLTDSYTFLSFTSDIAFNILDDKNKTLYFTNLIYSVDKTIRLKNTLLMQYFTVYFNNEFFLNYIQPTYLCGTLTKYSNAVSQNVLDAISSDQTSTSYKAYIKWINDYDNFLKKYFVKWLINFGYNNGYTYAQINNRIKYILANPSISVFAFFDPRTKDGNSINSKILTNALTYYNNSIKPTIISQFELLENDIIALYKSVNIKYIKKS
jgi:hypothetical protein